MSPNVAEATTVLRKYCTALHEDAMAACSRAPNATTQTLEILPCGGAAVAREDLLRSELTALQAERQELVMRTQRHGQAGCQGCKAA